MPPLEWLTLSMEYGPDFHGHERVLSSERVFHGFDPAKAHRSQFLHPILRYCSWQGGGGGGGETVGARLRAAAAAAATRTDGGSTDGCGCPLSGGGGGGGGCSLRSEHHVLEDTFTDFSSEVLHVRPLIRWLDGRVAVVGAPTRPPEERPDCGWPSPTGGGSGSGGRAAAPLHSGSGRRAGAGGGAGSRHQHPHEL